MHDRDFELRFHIHFKNSSTLGIFANIFFIVLLQSFENFTNAC